MCCTIVDIWNRLCKNNIEPMHIEHVTEYILSIYHRLTVISLGNPLRYGLGDPVNTIIRLGKEFYMYEAATESYL